MWQSHRDRPHLVLMKSEAEPGPCEVKYMKLPFGGSKKDGIVVNFIWFNLISTSEMHDSHREALINVCHVPGAEKSLARVTDIKAAVTGKGGTQSP